MSASTVAVIDVGSNSIKLLVARRSASGTLRELVAQTIDARIGTGMGRADPRLDDAAMERAIAAVQELLAAASSARPDRTLLVATSAVRGAMNGRAFAARVADVTSHELRILSGDEEAALIGAGIVCDPALQRLRDFYLFDLGGGSLECLAFRGRAPAQASSLPAGCVRLMEKSVPNPEAPFTPDLARAISEAVWSIVDGHGWRFILPAGTPVVGTGGTVSCARAIIGARSGRTLEASEPVVTVEQLRELLDSVGGRPLAERRRVPGLPPRRADVFPTALATLIAIAECGRFDAFHHSFYNLRWGVAAEALAARPSK